MVKRIADAFLWPGTKVCQYLGVNPEDDMGLIRSMFNMLFYLTVSLIIVWIVI